MLTEELTSSTDSALSEINFKEDSVKILSCAWFTAELLFKDMLIRRKRSPQDIVSNQTFWQKWIMKRNGDGAFMMTMSILERFGKYLCYLYSMMHIDIYIFFSTYMHVELFSEFYFSIFCSTLKYSSRHCVFKALFIYRKNINFSVNPKAFLGSNCPTWHE